MRVPAIRLPFLSGLGSRLLPDFLFERSTWLYTLYTVFVFLVALAITFPHDLLVQRAVRQLDRGPFALHVSGAGVDPLRGYFVNGVRIGAGEGGTPPLLEVSTMWARPNFREWLRGNFYAAVVGAELYGGILRGNVTYQELSLAGTVTWNGLQLARYRTLQSQLEDGQISGQVSGELTFEMRGQRFQQGQANGEVALDALTLQDVKISGWPIPNLSLKQLKTKLKVSPGKIELTDLSASGDLSIQGGGQITLREPFGESTLNLRLTVAPSPQTSDTLRAALALLPKPAGGKPDSPVTISGTILRPRLR
jgi:type II secretion system protein N